jgi:hypothetical protein
MLMKNTPNIEFVAAFTLKGMLKSGSGVYTSSADDVIYCQLTYFPKLY